MGAASRNELVISAEAALNLFSKLPVNVLILSSSSVVDISRFVTRWTVLHKIGIPDCGSI